MAFKDLDDGQKHNVVTVMERIGGSFVYFIARAWRQADSMNKPRLESAFADLFDKYAASYPNMAMPDPKMPPSYEEVVAGLLDVLSAYVPDWDAEEYSDIGGSVSRARVLINRAKKAKR